jgi:hypothetical protein
MKKYLGLSDIEIKENEKMWFEEQGNLGVDADTTGSDLRNVGISTGDIGGDLDDIADLEAEPAADTADELGGAGDEAGDSLPGTV